MECWLPCGQCRAHILYQLLRMRSLCLTVHDGECFILFQLQIYMLYTQLYDHYRTKLADEVLQYFQHDPCDRSAPHAASN